MPDPEQPDSFVGWFNRCITSNEILRSGTSAQIFLNRLFHGFGLNPCCLHGMRRLLFFQSSLCLLVLNLFAGCSTAPKHGSSAIAPQPSQVPLLSQSPVATMTGFGIYYIPSRRSKIELLNPHIANKKLTLYEQSEPTSFVSNTVQIPGTIRTQFGFTYRIAGLLPGAQTNILCSVSHPLMQAPDGRSKTHSYWTVPCRAGQNGVAQGLIGYQLEEPYEIVAGLWTFRIYLNNDLLLMKEFSVLPATK